MSILDKIVEVEEREVGRGYNEEKLAAAMREPDDGIEFLTPQEIIRAGLAHTWFKLKHLSNRLAHK